MNPGLDPPLKGRLGSGFRPSLVIAGLLVAGCTNPEAEYAAPDMSTQMGAAYSREIREHFGDTQNEEGAARMDLSCLEDPVLETLIHELIRSNLTLAAARERIAEAEAQRGVMTGQRQPQVNLEAEGFRAGTGEDGLAFMGPPPGQEMDIYAIGGLASWEIDFWGRTKNMVEAGDRESEAYLEAWRHATVSLVAELSIAYIEARTMEQQLLLLDEQIHLIEQSRNLAKSLLEAGNGTELEVLNANRQLEQLRAQKPVLQQGLQLAINRIAVLTGKPPSKFGLPPGGLPESPRLTNLGLPAELLVRRADIRQAERMYAASVARSRSAEAERYPRLSLSGSLKLQTNDMGKLISGDALVYSLGPNLSYPLFSGGRIESQIDVRQSQAEQARLRLQQTLLEAVAEVEDAALSVIHTTERMQHLEHATREAQRTVELSKQLHSSGLGNRMQLIDAERALLNREEESLATRREQLNSFVGLFRSLGGGWQQPQP